MLPSHSRLHPCLPLVAILLATRSLFAVTMAIPFGNHMVLQRGMKVPVWGKGQSAEVVTVSFDGQTKTATTGTDGTWKVVLDPMVACGPFTLSAKGSTTVSFTDVMVGEVWQCAGQSNMDTRMSYSEYPSLADSIKNANVPKLRYVTMRQPGQTIQWQTVTPSTVGALSATGYFFGKDLVQHLDGVTVGLVVTAVGGTTIAQWMDPASIAANAALKADTTAGSQFDSWVKPVVGYAIAGTAWYQGEQDCSSALFKYYTERLTLLTTGWRKLWGQGNFPFLIAQLAHAHAKQTIATGTSNYGEVRESQRLVARDIPNAFLEVNIDLGSTTTLHYDQKPIVGHRLGLLARGGVYKESGLSAWRSPEPLAAWVSDGAVRVLMTEIGGGLKTSDGTAPAGFAIAGSDGAWTWGTATLHGDTVVVQNASVPKPTQIRYAFSDFPIDNVVGGSGLPLSPFRFANLSSQIPVSTSVPVQAGPGWRISGRRLIADAPNGSTLALLSPDGRILSRPDPDASAGRLSWDLGPGSGIRMFRIEKGGRTSASGKVALP